MRTFIFLPTLFLASSVFVLAESGSSLQTLSSTEADAIVEAEMKAQAEREASQRARLLDTPATQEWVVDRPEGRMVFRRVEAPVRESSRAAGESVVEATETEEPASSERDRVYVNFTLFVAVFDDETTEIRIAPLHDEVSVVSNVSFSFLPAIESLHMEDATYSFFSFVERIAPDSPLWQNRPDPGIFSTTAPEYFICANSETDLPPELFEAMDALHRHYLKHEADFEARAQRADALRAARERYPQPASRETTVNFYPVRSRLHLPDSSNQGEME